MAGVGELRNLGPKSRSALAEIGIVTENQLRELGAVEAYARLRFRFGKVISRNMLHALAAALADVDWRQLTDEHKAELDRSVAKRLAEFENTPI
jgi:DNA transformation protein